MERTLRERGVGDLSVPRQVKRMMQGCHGRALALDAALCSENDATARLQETIARNVFGAEEVTGGVKNVCQYVNLCDRYLSRQSKTLLRGETGFPEIEYEQEKTGSGPADIGVAA
jgi:cytochrome b pre-mRNA-processing protein 3